MMTPNRVISYHKVDTKKEIGITVVSPKSFRKQIEYLVRKGYKFVTLSELFFDTDPKKIAITFDDGYQDNFTYAYPILKEFDAVATVFIITDFIGKFNTWDANLGWIKFMHMNDTEIRTLIEEGWEIGSHGISHQALRNVEQSELNYEIGQSKAILEDKFNCDINFFSSPFGKVTEDILNTVKNYGYKGCCGFYPRKFMKENPPESQIPRLAVYMGEGPKTVENKISTDNGKLKREIYKQNFISFWNNLTITVKAIK